MEARRLEVVDAGIATHSEIIRARGNDRKNCRRYRIAVVGTSVAEIVQHAGGFLFDYGIAGWDVTVIAPANAGCRALQILGARVLDLDSKRTLSTYRSSLPGDDLTVDAVMGQADLFRARQELPEVLSRRFDCAAADFLLWGDLKTIDRPRLREYRMSIAAKAFKNRALEAVGTISLDGSRHTEVFAT
jgi:hypothetical protein